MQDLCGRAYRFFHRFKRGSNPKAWLLTILRNIYINDFRKRTKGPLTVSLEEVEPSHPLSADNGFSAFSDSPNGEALEQLSTDDEARNMIVQIEQKISEKEEIFFKLDVSKNDDSISVTIQDNINDYSFYSDPNVEVYLKEYEEPSIEELMRQVHSMPTDHSKIDPSMHMTMLQPDKDKLIDGTIRLENSVNAFTGIIPKEWENARIIVLYGNNQNYYLTKIVKLDQNS